MTGAKRPRVSFARVGLSVAGLLLVVEFLDELVFGTREAAWPLVRDDLGLSYAEVGLLLALPNLASAVLEPAFGMLGDTRRRGLLVAGGGVAYGAALVAFAGAPGFAVALMASLVLYPASGAFVSLSQASLMDTDPERTEQLMARWAFAGSAGVVVGPLLLGLAVAGGAGWRGAFIACAVGALALALPAGRRPAAAAAATSPATVADAVRSAREVARRPATWRWLTLLGFSDLMLDVFLGFLALYFVDVAGTSERTAGMAVITWSVVGLAGDGLLMLLLERLPGLRYLRWSARVMVVLFPAFLLAPWLAGKLVLLGAIGLVNAGWYAILKAQLYREFPGQSGGVVAVYSLFTSVTGLAPAVIGLAAQRWGLDTAMWLLLAGPLALVAGIPRNSNRRADVAGEE